MSKLYIRNRYGTAPNELLNREDISFKAKGLYVFIQSKPDGWAFSLDRIAKQSNEGKDAVRSGIKELEDAGYLIRTATKDSDGTWDGYDYTLLEIPSSGFPTTVNPTLDNGHTLSKKDSSKKEVVISSETLVSREKDTVIEEQLYEDIHVEVDEEFAPVRNLKRAGPAPSEPLLEWATRKSGRKFASPLKQRKCIITLQSAGYDDEDIKAMWLDLEVDPFWANKGIDFGTVLSQADRLSARVDTSKLKSLYDSRVIELNKMISSDMPREEVRQFIAEFIKPLRDKYGFR